MKILPTPEGYSIYKQLAALALSQPNRKLDQVLPEASESPES